MRVEQVDPPVGDASAGDQRHGEWKLFVELG
jgi:hypothetical protein